VNTDQVMAAIHATERLINILCLTSRQAPSEGKEEGDAKEIRRQKSGGERIEYAIAITETDGRGLPFCLISPSIYRGDLETALEQLPTVSRVS